MKTINLVIVAILLLGVVSNAIAQANEKSKVIEINLTKIERVSILPPELTNVPQYRKDDFDKPRSGYNYAIVYFTVLNMEDIFVHSIGESVLFDSNKHTYECVKFSFHGTNCKDPHDIRSCSIFTKGSSGVVVFELPVQVDATMFRIIYSYLSSLKEKEEYRRGMIDINLTR